MQGSSRLRRRSPIRSVTEGALGAIAISQRNRQGYQSQLQNPRTDHDTNSEVL